MTTTTAARRSRLAAVVVLAGWSSAGPAGAHPGEGVTPYRYVVAPLGVASEGAAEAGVSTQPFGSPGFAGTTDNQMQLTLPSGALPARLGEQGVRVELTQLDPAALPPLPTGLEAEGNGYRVSLRYQPSGIAVQALAAPATLSISAPAAPTGVLELENGHWVPRRHTPVAQEAGFSSVVELDGPMTLMQVYAPPPGSARAATPPPTLVAPSATGQDPSAAGSSMVTGVPVALTAVLVVAAGLFLVRRGRTR